MKKLLVILFGLVAIGVGIFLLVTGNSMKKRCTAEAVGTVVEVIEEREESADPDTVSITYTYYPVIEYTAGDKTLTQKYSTGYGNRNKFKVGDKIEILYDPSKPEDYLIKNDKSSNLIGIAFIAVGAVVTVIGIVKRNFV